MEFQRDAQPGAERRECGYCGAHTLSGEACTTCGNPQTFPLGRAPAMVARRTGHALIAPFGVAPEPDTA